MSKTKFIKYALISLCFVMLLCLCGCKKKQTDQEVIEDLQDYMMEKYGRTFRYTKLWRGNAWIGDYDELTLKTDYDGDGIIEYFYARRYYRPEDESYLYQDNYVWYIMLDDFEEYMREYTDKYFSEYKLYADFDPDDDFPMSVKNFDDLKSCEEGVPYLDFYIFVKESSVENIDQLDELAEKYEEELSELDIDTSCRGFFVVDDEKFEKITRDNFKEK